MNKPFIDFEKRLVIVSGASSGLGKQIAIELASLNARVLLLGRNQERLEKTLESLSGVGHRIQNIDLSNLNAIKGELTPLLKEMGNVYGLCHCAGIVKFRPLNSTNIDVLQSQFDINFTACLELAKLTTNRTLATQGEGSLVFLSSVCAESGAAGQIGYCATKGAINAAVRAMAIEFAPRNIKVNSISPGVIRTEMTEQKSGLTPEQLQSIVAQYPLGEGATSDVARVAVFLLAPENRWITGIDLKVDGGFAAY